MTNKKWLTIDLYESWAWDNLSVGSGNDYEALNAEAYGTKNIVKELLAEHIEYKVFNKEEYNEFYAGLRIFQVGGDWEDLVEMYKDLVDYDDSKTTNIYIFEDSDICEDSDMQ